MLSVRQVIVAPSPRCGSDGLLIHRQHWERLRVQVVCARIDVAREASDLGCDLSPVLGHLPGGGAVCT
jgi:hypothetical protein